MQSEWKKGKSAYKILTDKITEKKALGRPRSKVEGQY